MVAANKEVTEPMVRSSLSWSHHLANFTYATMTWLIDLVVYVSQMITDMIRL